MPAAQDELGAPALAFVRTVCAVLALDSGLQQEVAVLRRNLLKLVHVREFAPASEFKASVLMAPCGLSWRASRQLWSSDASQHWQIKGSVSSSHLHSLAQMELFEPK